ncbi:hypothetical protein BD31_I0162 [Candidatus Nitrosopumilus salaria BD31]|uniref:Uncharacterized protein n=1 Tax=Candidatus Nitrosopumilus salarius BD31 TaxID=859350 RepID=I3D2Q8_9ARCH|nr:hypothetical protein [Candidatus Nitrosopumilus salaria]EIJ66001.1 hypothetical protein BD31_I0162 [Candidatus Nitrosopumilus salaria BD31]
MLILGTCFLTAQSIENSLSDAFTVGEYLWLVLGGLTITFAIRAKHEKNKQLGVLR